MFLFASSGSTVARLPCHHCVAIDVCSYCQFPKDIASLKSDFTYVFPRGCCACLASIMLARCQADLLSERMGVHDLPRNVTEYVSPMRGFVERFVGSCTEARGDEIWDN